MERSRQSGRRPTPESAAAAAAANASVVICAYTEARWTQLLAAVRSAQVQRPAPREVVVVIDHAEDLLERARSEIEGATVVANDRASGLSGARNAGWSAASGEVVAFLDDDAVADPGWLQELMRPLADPLVLGSGGRIEPRWLTARPRWFPEPFQWVVGCTYRAMGEREGAIRNPFGASMAVRREVLAEIGGFREGVGSSRNNPLDPGTAGTDETEMAIRAGRRFATRRWVYAPDALVFHEVPAERSSWSYFRSRCRDEGRAKAALAAIAGRGDALASERRYARRVLPAAVLEGFADPFRGHPAGWLRAGAVLVGLTEAAIAYARGRLALRTARRR